MASNVQADAATEPALATTEPTPAQSDPEAGQHYAEMVPLSTETFHRVGEDTWYEVGFHIIAALNTAFILGYPALIMGFLGWIAGPICMIGGAAISFYNNCLLGALHETGGKRHVRYRDLAGYIYGPVMYKLTWLSQYSCLVVANIGTIILAGQSLKAIARAFSDGSELVKLPGWIAVTGAVVCIFALLVPTLHALRFFSTISLVLSSIYTYIAIAIAFNDGLKSAEDRDYSLKGGATDRTFNAIGALATIAFAFNTGILPEMQATVKQPTTRNIRKALGLQFTVGTFPILLLTFVGYWAYGNAVSPYMLNSVSGPKSAVTVANVAAFLQAIISLHIYASPIYEFMDTHFARKGDHEWSSHSVLVRLFTRTTYIGISTFLGALLPFFGDFIALVGALAAFPLEWGLIHHMYLKVKGKEFGKRRQAWHWSMIVVAILLTFATSIAGLRYIISDSIRYHEFADL
ncbi:hypothetical protein KC19_7G047800 [Ceratodon purpureus]|uniref:Amino acid transporter transmembrane domain-containing protein n=1 Tax=Ceratodon purpureus TaxID=3225 RepID=A0A8T0H2A2_CERPU|nr:hypothetical protein KC19_7G047800 [Ceratodon purpureus]